MKKSGIYIIQSISKPERIYVGSTVYLDRRKSCHFHSLRKKTHDNPKLLNHAIKYGIKDLSFTVIEQFKFISKEHLLAREQFFIDTLKPWFNITKTAGSSLGVKHTKESRKKMSESAKKKPKISEETRQKMSKSQSRRKMPEEVKRKLSIAKKGIPPTHIVMEAARRARLGIKQSEETKRKRRETMLRLGYPRKGQILGMLGKHHRDESKKRISLSIKEVWKERLASNYISPLKGKSIYTEEERLQRTKIAKIRYKKKLKLMAELHINELTAENLINAEIPMNHVLIETDVDWSNKKSKGGIIVGFNEDVLFAEGDSSHVADLTIPYGIVKKTPKLLYFNPDDSNSMDWETSIEIKEGDMVWFSLMESRNAVCVLCEQKLYRILPYADCYVAKRRFNMMERLDFALFFNISLDETIKEVCIPLNGYVLCEILYKPKISPLDALSENMVDNTRGRVKHVGAPPKAYLRKEYCHIEDLRVGDEVLFDNPAAVFLLERTKALAQFDGDNLYWVVPRRRISLILNR